MKRVTLRVAWHVYDLFDEATASYLANEQSVYTEPARIQNNDAQRCFVFEIAEIFGHGFDVISRHEFALVASEAENACIVLGVADGNVEADTVANIVGKQDRVGSGAASNNK